MLIFAIDENRDTLAALHEAVVHAEPGAEILDYASTPELIRAVTEQGLRPDLVFSETRFSDTDGLALAARIKMAVPGVRIVFVTGCGDDALAAYQNQIQGYLMKPVDAALIRRELEALRMPPLPKSAPMRLQVQCFGHFEVFWMGKPLVFRRRQSKELLAYLIDREGALCSAEEIALSLWGEEADMPSSRNRIRVLINDLRSTLQAIGMEALLIRERRQLAIRRDMVECDYYRMKAGDPAALNLWQGEYMVDYSWAEATAGQLYFQMET